MFFQAQSEKLLTWDMAVKDFHLLIKLVKVCLSFHLLAPPPLCLPLVLESANSVFPPPLHVSTARPSFQLFDSRPVVNVCLKVSTLGNAHS